MATTTTNRGTKTILIPIESINVEKYRKVGGEPTGEKDRLGYWDTVILQVGDLNVAGFTIGLIPEGYEGRREYGGPMIPGPWAYAFANPGIIDNHGGTRAELERAKARGLLFRAEIGDRLDLGGVLFEIRLDHNRNIKLVKVEAEPESVPPAVGDEQGPPPHGHDSWAEYGLAEQYRAEK